MLQHHTNNPASSHQISDCVRFLSKTTTKSFNVGYLGTPFDKEYRVTLNELMDGCNIEGMLSFYLNLPPNQDLSKLMRGLQVPDRPHLTLSTCITTRDSLTATCFPQRFMNLLISHYQPCVLNTPVPQITPQLLVTDQLPEFRDLAASEFTNFLNLRFKELTHSGLLHMTLMKQLPQAHLINSIWRQHLSDCGQTDTITVTLPFFTLDSDQIRAGLQAQTADRWTLTHLAPTTLANPITLPVFHTLAYPHLLAGLMGSPWAHQRPHHQLHGFLASFFTKLRASWAPDCPLEAWVVVAQKVAAK